MYYPVLDIDDELDFAGNEDGSKYWFLDINSNQFKLANVGNIDLNAVLILIVNNYDLGISPADIVATSSVSHDEFIGRIG